MARAVVYYRNTGQPALAEHWEAELAKAGRCPCCGRLLTDPKSVADSIGPQCRRKEPRYPQ
jgi:hypothetical protein